MIEIPTTVSTKDWLGSKKIEPYLIPTDNQTLTSVPLGTSCSNPDSDGKSVECQEEDADKD